MKLPKHRLLLIWDDEFDKLPEAITCEITPIDNELKPDPKTSGEVILDGPRLVAIKELTKLYGLKLSAVYGLIKTDSSFPVVNIGLKKKYMIDLIHFEKWLTTRTAKEKQDRSHHPTSQDLLKMFKEKK